MLICLAVGCGDDSNPAAESSGSTSSGDGSTGAPPSSDTSGNETGDSSAADTESTTAGSESSTGHDGGVLDGIWRTEGYGWIYAVEGDDIVVYEVTSDSCMQVVVGTVVEPNTADAARVDLEVPGLFTLGMSVIEGDAGALHFLADGLIVAPPAHTVDALPDACAEAPDGSDVAVFDTLTAWFDEHYALFGDRDADWPGLVAQHRADLTGEDPPPLFEVFSSLLGPLEDAHISLQGPEGVFEGRRIEAEPVTEAMVEEAQALISEGYLVTERQSWVDGQIEFARLPGDVGYLAAHGFGPLVGEDGRLDYLAAVAEFEGALDEVFSGEAMAGLVIDLRTNGGGSDLYGLALASRLTTESYTAYSVRARIDTDDDSVFSELEAVMVEPSANPGFDGPVAVLVGRDTVSAAETAALALRGRPEITVFGERTQGAFSSVLNHFLPNGWLMGLPNEHYLTEAGERFDVVGIPPDVETPVFTTDDLSAARDSALDAALASFEL
ncbi:MAG: S41 family peptidase [Nannocystales bacterium]